MPRRAAIYHRLFEAERGRPVQTVLELGSGGGNNASHLKAHYALTLSDLSPAMLALSRTINPELEHIEGDMRSLRLGRTFRRGLRAGRGELLGDGRRSERCDRDHCGTPEAGGVAIFHPDHTRETFRPSTSHGGHDGADGRSLRYLEWVHDPDASDDSYMGDHVYLLRHAHGRLETVLDRHVVGMLPRATWLRLLDAAGFEARAVPFERSEVEPGGSELFLARKRL